MGFFKDFKEDLSEAVNGLTDNELENESDERDDDLMVNTLDDPELAKMAENYKKEAQESEDTDNNAVGLLLGVIVAVVVWFLSMLSVWALYSFADLVEYTKANNEILASMDSTLGQIADCLSSGENNENAE